MTVQTQFDRLTPAPEGASHVRNQGGFAILHGTFAPEGCVVRPESFEQDAFDGPARVFSTTGDALEAIARGRIRACDIMVIRNDARDADLFATSGLTEVTAALDACGIERVTVITDSRINGTVSGTLIGNVAPTAAAGGPIAYINDDDIIHIDIAGRRIDVMADIDLRRGARLKKAGAQSFSAAARYAAMVSADTQ